MKKLIATLYLLAMATGVANAQTQVDPDTALRMLNAQQQQFQKGVIKVADNRNYYLSYANELESGELSELWF